MIVGTLNLELTISQDTRAFLTGLVDQLARALVVDRHVVEARIRAELAADVQTNASGGGTARQMPAASALQQPHPPEPVSAEGAAGQQAKATAPVRDPGVEGRSVEAGPSVSDAGLGEKPFGMVASGAPPATSPAPDTAMAGAVAATPSAAHPADTPATAAPVEPPALQRGSVSSHTHGLAVPAETRAPAVSAPSAQAGASFPAGAKPILWSPERDDVLRAGYPAGLSNRELLDQVNALPGRVANLDQIVPRCMYLKLRRGPDTPRKRPPSDAPKPTAMREGMAAADEVPEFLERTEADIRQWCAFSRYKLNALTEQALADINSFRHGKGLPPYRLIATPPPPPPAQPHPASYETILRWANQRGLCMDGKLDLKVVNAKAINLGLAPFELENSPPRFA